MEREEDVWSFIFAAAKIGLIAVLAYGQCRSASLIRALEARVEDLSARLEAKPAERGNDVASVGKLLISVECVRAHDKRHDADGARAVVLDDEDGRTEVRGRADDKADARGEALADPVADFVRDAERGDGGEEKRKGFISVHGGDYSKGAAGAQRGEAAP